MICVVVSICIYELAGQQSHSLLQVSDIREVLLLGFYPASEMASFVADMNKEHQQVDLTSEDVAIECLGCRCQCGICKNMRLSVQLEGFTTSVTRSELEVLMPFLS